MRIITIALLGILAILSFAMAAELSKTEPIKNATIEEKATIYFQKEGATFQKDISKEWLTNESQKTAYAFEVQKDGKEWTVITKKTSIDNVK